MAFQPVPNTIQCDVVFLLFGQRVENVFHVQVPGGVDAPTIADTANEMGAWVLSDYLPQLSASLVFLSVEAKNLSIDSGGVAIYTAPGGSVGGIVQPSEPGNVTFSISLHTASSGRSYRGRKYVPGMPLTMRTENSVNTGWADALVTALNSLISVLAAVDKLLVIVSRIQDHVVLTTAVATPVVNASYTDLFIDSQRRRLTGRGT
jgi:hypothetical protein